MKLLAFVLLSGGSFKLNISTHITSVKVIVLFYLFPLAPFFLQIIGLRQKEIGWHNDRDPESNVRLSDPLLLFMTGVKWGRLIKLIV